MMIRLFEQGEIDAVMDIWLKANISAHKFISKEYWEDNYMIVKIQYIPYSETFVYEKDGSVKAFVSIVKNHFIGALFVMDEHQGSGIGTQLIDYCKMKYPKLQLSVYKDNLRALEFYKKCGFLIDCEQLNEDSLFPEYLMSWSRS